MKNVITLKFIVIMANTILLLNPNLFSQCLPYLGQTPPGNNPIRLVPDSLAANSAWQYHGTPTFSPDGMEMYYAIYQFNPGRIEIWFTECVNGNWAVPKKAPFSNDNYGNNNPLFSNHRDTLYFISSRPGGYIFRVTRTNGIWSSPVAINLQIPSGFSGGWQFSMADNGNIYGELSSQGNADDIYIWRYINNQYQTPEKLTAICSPELDFTPFIDPQERFILFASRRSGGFGNTDIYISKKNSDGNWLAPINLGQVINSGEVISPILSRDGKYFFFEAWMPGAVGGNPYWMDANFINNYITDIKDEPGITTGFDLNQNYPNPFNPITRISWQSPVASLQSLKIYNILGNEVATLVDEYKPAGNYEIEFDASGLASGMYLYRLHAGNFVRTSKMILLK